MTPKTRRRNDRLGLVEKELKHTKDVLKRTQQLLLDFIWFQGYGAFHQPSFNGYRFIAQNDRDSFRKMTDAMVKHGEDIP